MTVTTHSSVRERIATHRLALLAALCIAALLALIAAGLYGGGTVRAALVFFAGVTAGAAAAMAWRRDGVDTTAEQNMSSHAAPNELLTWKDLMTAMPEPALILSRTSGILNYNSPARSIFEGLKIGIPLEHVDRDPEFIAAVSSVFDTGERRSARLRLRGGRGRRFTATVTPVGENVVTAVLITLHDESEQERLLEMRTDFIANASHELRTPLASVRGFIETLQGSARDDETARNRFLNIMAEQAERMTRLIDDLLLLSRVEEKANLKPIGKVQLDQLIREVVRTIAPAAAERGITITVAPESSPLIANGDRDELFQVFHNLIENAVKYGHDKGSVNISLSEIPAESDGKSGNRAAVTVADDGPGIALEHLPRLTERFYRVSAEHSRRIGGTGLGLAIVKHVLSRHEGELSVESVVGQGTTFRVLLPTAR
ncbi:MAG TPA: ATP-binding protein [Hyphomicrobium sp.]|nr:ATP-binding protein [Hyphomicrobium sp.]